MVITKKERNPLFDTVKFVLIILVVMGHVPNYDISEIEAHLSEFINIAIYSFHMPAFIFVSGYFSKNITAKGFLKSSLLLFETYIIFQILHMSLEYRDITLYTFFARPEWVMWYIVSLIYWRLFVVIIKSFSRKYNVAFLFLSILLSICIGFFSKIPEFALLRTIMFFPFFFLGYMINENQIMKLRTKKWRIILILYIPIAIFSWLYVQENNLIHLFTSARGYYFFENMSAYKFVLYRVLVLINSLMLTIMLFVYIPKRLPFGLSKYGADTMCIFLFHITIFVILRRYIYTSHYYYNLIIYTLSGVVIPLVITRIINVNYLTNPFSSIYNKIIAKKKS